MSAFRIEHGPYDIETTSYDIGTGLYERLRAYRIAPEGQSVRSLWGALPGVTW